MAVVVVSVQVGQLPSGFRLLLELRLVLSRRQARLEPEAAWLFLPQRRVAAAGSRVHRRDVDRLPAIIFQEVKLRLVLGAGVAVVDQLIRSRLLDEDDRVANVGALDVTIDLQHSVPGVRARFNLVGELGTVHVSKGDPAGDGCRLGEDHSEIDVAVDVVAVPPNRAPALAQFLVPDRAHVGFRHRWAG